MVAVANRGSEIALKGAESGAPEPFGLMSRPSSRWRACACGEHRTKRPLTLGPHAAQPELPGMLSDVHLTGCELEDGGSAQARRTSRWVCAGPSSAPTHGRAVRQLRRNTDRFSATRLAQFALAVSLIVTVTLVRCAKRWDSMAVA
jgi:hypothetical protein